MTSVTSVRAINPVQNMQGSASASSLIKRSLPWIGASIVIAVLAARAWSAYQLQAPVDCKFGSFKDDLDAAHAFYKQAVQLDNRPEDKYCLAQSFEQGIGVSSSLEDARQLYLAAAEQGLSVAAKKLCSEALWRNGDTKINEDAVKKICCAAPNLFERLGFYTTCDCCYGPITAARLNTANP